MALRTVLSRSARLAAPLAVRARSGPAFGQLRAASTASVASGTSAASSRTALLAFAAAGAAGCSVAFAAAPVTPSVSKEEIAACTAAIEEILDENDNMGPTIVRLAWHASGTYDKVSGTGGSEGATMRFAPEAGHGANAGLGVARNALEPVKRLFPNITYADLWTLAGAVAIEYMGGPKVNWKPGRRDAVDESECTPDGRLPDADKGGVGKTVRHVRDIFYRQGFNDREIVALIGAHALGRCYTDRSGYSGPWTRSETSFSNTFYTELLNNTWTLKQWEGPDQFEDQTGDLMMLPSDMAMLWDKDFRKHVEEFAKDEDIFFKEFAKAFQKLEENGVKAFSSSGNVAGSWYKFW